jgi:hypothetical protein
MDFPITRERLQNFQGEYNEFYRLRILSKIVEDLSSRITGTAGRHTSQNLKVGMGELGIPGGYDNILGRISDYIPQIITKLQERFPDTTITLDPMKSYLYIDWSRKL